MSEHVPERTARDTEDARLVPPPDERNPALIDAEHAYVITLIKANLVVQNFMHLGWEQRVMKWMLATSLVLMLVLFAGVSPDVMKHEGDRWINNAALAARRYERAGPA